MPGKNEEENSEQAKRKKKWPENREESIGKRRDKRMREEEREGWERMWVRCDGRKGRGGAP